MRLNCAICGLGRLSIAACAAAFPETALAQHAPAPLPEAAAPAAIAPPRLVEASQPSLPDDAGMEGDELTVVVRIVVDREGKVTTAEVTDSQGDRFDEAAREAALRSRFEPARRADGTAVPARVNYRVVFRRATQGSDAAGTAPPAGTAATATTPPAVTPREPGRSAPLVEAATVAEEPPEEISVWGRQTATKALQDSAEAVVVYDLRKNHGEATDLGEILARMQGVSVRRDGGLGSTTQFGMNGCYEDQVRSFFDGVPLELAGYPFGIANVPLNLVQRVELYRGVVPIRFGADALCGAANLVSDQSYKTRLGVSYQVGSYATHRTTVDGMYRAPKSGFVIGGSAFADRTKNDYEIDVDLADAQGQLSPATVRRFNDRYSSAGFNVQVGMVDKPWARRLLLQAFTSAHQNELQHNRVMTVPYGEVHWNQRVSGATLRYEVPLGEGVELELTGNFSHRTQNFVDKAKWVYDWTGQRVRERRLGGEIDGDPTDQMLWENTLFTRAYVKWSVSPGHELRFVATPTYTARTGDERIQLPGSRDPLAADRDHFKMVLGAEYELELWRDRLSNIVFVKDYLYRTSTEELIPGNVFRARETNSHTQGIGDALRFRLTPWAYLKASYEYATRLPNPDQVFGNGVLIQANLDLLPETSHNGNFGPRFEAENTPAGSFVFDANGFVREKHNQIVLLGNDRRLMWQNVFTVLNVGVEGQFTWVAPKTRLVALGGTFTWNEERNFSNLGTFGNYEGDRIPSRPWLFASWHARLHFNKVPRADDAIEPYYYGRYVHEFYRGWQSLGDPDFKSSVATQVVHSVGVSWTVRREHVGWGSTLEVDNVTDAKVFDHYGLQKPGRAYFVKMVGEFR